MGSIKKYFSIIVVIIIIIPFTFWGVYGYFANAPVAVSEVGSIDGEPLTLNQLREIQARVMSNAANQNNGVIPEEYQDTRYVEGLSAQLLVEQEVYDVAVDTFKMNIGDSYFANLIANLSEFKTDGIFDKGKFNAFLIERDITALDFEREYRKIFNRDNIVSSITGTTLQNEWERRYLIKLFLERRSIDVYHLSPYNLAQSLEVSDERVREYYTGNQNEFKVKETLDVEYILFNRNEVEDDFSPSTEAIAEVFETQYAGSSAGERRKASHILIEDLSDAEAISQLNEIRKQAISFSEFGRLAKEHSADSGSKDVGGELGWIGNDGLDEDFEDALFSLRLDMPLSVPIKSAFGYHLIYLQEVESGDEIKLEDVRDSMVRQLRDEYLSEKYGSTIIEIEDYIAANAENLDGLSKTLGVSVSRLTGLTQDEGESDFSDDTIRSEAFEFAKNSTGMISEVITISDEEIMVYKPVRYTPISVADFETVKQQATILAKLQLAREQLPALKKEVETAVKNGEELSEGEYLSINKDSFILRLDINSTLPEDMIHDIFGLSGEFPASTAIGSYKSDGEDYFIYVLKDVTYPSDEEIESLVSIKDFEEYFAKLRSENSTIENIVGAYGARALLEYDNSSLRNDTSLLSSYLRSISNVRIDPEYILEEEKQ